MDESNTHKRDADIIMGGFLGHAYQWRRFEKKLKAIQANKCFSIFHSKEFKDKTGEFDGWSDEKCLELLGELCHLVADNLTEGMAISLPYARYINEYRSTSTPKGMNLDSQYGLCFRACLGHMLDVVAQKGQYPKLHIVIENGHKNVGDVERIFYDTKKRWKDLGMRYDIFGEITIAEKADAPPLMVADFLAHTYSLMQKDKNAEGLDPRSMPPPIPRKAALAFLEFTPDSLHNLKLGYQQLKQHGINQWKARKEAKKNAAPSDVSSAAQSS